MREHGPVWACQPEGLPSVSRGHLVQRKSSKHLRGSSKGTLVTSLRGEHNLVLGGGRSVGVGRGVNHLQDEHSPVLGESSLRGKHSPGMGWKSFPSLWEEASPVLEEI